jgi:hypothetical protein
MIANAAMGGHRELCVLAREWGATDFNRMLANATAGGHRGLCVLAREWGATDFNHMLEIAAGECDVDLCILGHSWGATNSDEFPCIIADGNACCEFARSGKQLVVCCEK